MNTLQNLIDNGIEVNTAIRMLSEYQKLYINHLQQ